MAIFVLLIGIIIIVGVVLFIVFATSSDKNDNKSVEPMIKPKYKK